MRRARLERPRQIWGRRSVAIGIALVGIALIGGIVLLATGGDDNGGNGSSQTSKNVAALQDKLLKHTVVSPQDGISVRRPADWRNRKVQGAITLFSPSRCVSVSTSAPAEAKQSKTLLTDSIKSLRQIYKKVEVAPGGPGAIGGIPTTSKTVQITDDKGNRRRVLLSVGKGKKNAYLTEVVVGSPSCGTDVAVAQVILSSVQYTK